MWPFGRRRIRGCSEDASNPNYVERLAKRIIETLSKPYEVDQNTLSLVPAFGSAVGPADGRTVELLMRSADLALYRSKEDGGNVTMPISINCMPVPKNGACWNLNCATRWNETNCISNISQWSKPMAIMALLGFEALFVGTIPNRNVSPAKFVPIAEEARLIVPIGDSCCVRRASMRWDGRNRQSRGQYFRGSADQPGFHGYCHFRLCTTAGCQHGGSSWK